MITKAKITAAVIKPTEADPEITVLYLTFSPENPIPFGDEEIKQLFYTIWNGPDWGRSWKRIELREALGLKPVCFTGQILVVPIFTEKDLPDLIGKELCLNIEEDPGTPAGPRVRVMNTLPKGIQE